MSTTEARANEVSKKESKPKCGIVMPISSIDDCTSEHWAEVLGILKDIVESIDFEPNLVSDADDIGIIQKRIIQNLYNNEIVVCDVSAKNPNVMFELGMRLAFDKPTIIIKDDKTDYTFDTSIIEHLTYPRDLRFSRIVEFKDNLKKKIAGTYEKSKSDPSYSTFLKNFGQYKISNLQETEISTNEYIIRNLSEIKNEIAKLRIEKINAESRERKDDSLTMDQYVGRKIGHFMELNDIKDLSFLVKYNDRLFEFLKKSNIIRNHYKTDEALREKLKAFFNTSL